MKGKLFVCSLVALLAAGCAGNKEVLAISVSEAEGMSRAAKAEGIQSSATVLGDKSLAEARLLAEDGKTDEALDAAEMSQLQYRLAFAEKDAKDAALADSASAKELQGDEESQKLYQGILDNETKDKEAVK